MSDVHPLVWRNGSLVEIGEASPSIASISFHMGTGVFDGMMAYWTEKGHHVFKGDEHFSRFLSSAENMGMPTGWTASKLQSATLDILKTGGASTYYIRPIAYRGGPELWLTGAEGRPVDVSIFAVPVDGSLNKPLICHYSKIERISNAAMPISWKVCGLYVNSYLARRNAERAGFDDGLMNDRHGFVSEASASNVFFIKKNRLLTPKLSGDVFPGITRKTVISICREHNIDVTEASLSRQELDVDGAFLCSTLMELRPITRLGDALLDTLNLDIYRAISSAFSSMTRGRRLPL
ncbi:aminotransferase class IV [Sinorhizobium meliloti]|uniref:aminotransferase class IV n=1 Tax=Rhizobium meliloti TaxID=382 RepID=UPI001297510E|nr:aminotransferase class IV [Sinorhizobium meliloti]MDE3857067.1 aminotransferase class IV [Sinorhizobium meliloti]MQW48109.1 branched chain amino acid aminotransferase [Sinorhizobium meliloti]